MGLARAHPDGSAASYGSGPLWSGGPDVSVAVTIGVVLAIGFIPTVMHAPVFAYIWSRSGSLAVTTVYHAAYDGMRDSLATTIGLGPIAGSWSGLLLLVVGAVLLWRGNWKGVRVALPQGIQNADFSAKLAHLA